ncbi:MAG: thioredoxin [Sphaerochaetaceae bacterium]|nr:thioredoxin [Spirochaetales bacterium]MDY3768556.1 thioredoxin [Sphaerochaetaceae bacterium]MDY5967577.1 thioredoxin [Sphaerochaetaceae bacterium]
MATEIKEAEFNEKVLNSKGTVVVDFFATWCGPCRMLGKVIEELSGEMDDVTFYKVNVDQASSLAASFGIESIPVLVVFKDGVKVHQVVGFQDKEAIKNLLK